MDEKYNTGQGTYSQILKRTCILDISKSCLQILQLQVNLLHRLLGLRDCRGLECLDGFDVCAYIIRYRFELLKQFGSIVDNCFILEDRAVVFKIDCGRLGGILGLETLRFTVSLAERLEGCDCLCSTAILIQSIYGFCIVANGWTFPQAEG